MKAVLYFALALVLSVGTANYGSAQVSDAVPSEISTLYAFDPLTQSICLRDGGPGSIFQGGQTRNRCSDLNFHSYGDNMFSVGNEGSKQGVIVDLGTPQELKTKYGYQETVGNGQGFASIRIRNGKALIWKDYKTGAMQEVSESAQLFGPPPRDRSVPVKLGHIYLLRITDSRETDFELIAKLIVVAHAPGESVTFRWQLLSDSRIAKL